MKILVICAQGNNRSVHFAHLLKYIEGNETLTAGTKKNTMETLEMLYNWADKIVVTDSELLSDVPNNYTSKIKLYDVGMDVYPRPFNPILLKRARAMLEVDPI